MKLACSSQGQMRGMSPSSGKPENDDCGRWLAGSAVAVASYFPGAKVQPRSGGRVSGGRCGPRPMLMGRNCYGRWNTEASRKRDKGRM